MSASPLFTSNSSSIPSPSPVLPFTMRSTSPSPPQHASQLLRSYPSANSTHPACINPMGNSFSCLASTSPFASPTHATVLHSSDGGRNRIAWSKRRYGSAGSCWNCCSPVSYLQILLFLCQVQVRGHCRCPQEAEVRGVPSQRPLVPGARVLCQGRRGALRYLQHSRRLGRMRVRFAVSTSVQQYGLRLRSWRHILCQPRCYEITSLLSLCTVSVYNNNCRSLK